MTSAQGKPPKHGYLIDMDGVIYRGHELIPGADRFIKQLLDRDIPFLFLTNNSQRTRRDVATKLQRMGIAAEEKHIFTCAMATARFLAHQKPGGTAYVIGEGGLLNALHANGYSIVDNDPDYVVVGEGRTLTFEMAELALRMLHHGARLIATNMDPNCPTSSGMRPGCGAIVSLLEVASGAKAFSVGKPNPIMMRAARKELMLSADECTVIGDTMETDILGGLQMGCETILVLSGGTKASDLERFSYRPDRILDSVAELCDEPIANSKRSPAKTTPSSKEPPRATLKSLRTDQLVAGSMALAIGVTTDHPVEESTLHHPTTKPANTPGRRTTA